MFSNPLADGGTRTPSLTRLVSRAVVSLVVLGALPFPARCEAPIRYIDSAKVWIISGGEASYVFGVNQRDELQSIYWGKRIWRDQDWTAVKSYPQWDGVDPSTNTTPEEYPGWGGLRFFEPCLKATLGGGVRDVVLKYASHEIRDDELVVTLKDIGGGLTVDLRYKIFSNGIVSKSAVIRNSSDAVVTIESAQSGAWLLPAADGYHLSYLAGRWGEETLYTREPIHRGSKVLESRRGSTSNQFNPWFAIDGPEEAGEEHGSVWFGALGWSGSWKIVVEQTPHRDLRITGGYNDYDFSYPLKPGESLSTPPFYAGFTDRGFGAASRLFHRFQLDHILPRSSAGHPRPVLYNSWEATGFAVDEPGQTALARKAAEIGVERFVMDDGWFGARNSSLAGLGDWTPNAKKFPNGLKPLIDNVKNLGMDFGLWVEPEMVNPDSDLYRAHPDWVLNFPGRPRSEARNQLVLNLSRDDVKEYIFASLDKLVSENDIAFLKWDLNRNFSEPGWPEALLAEQKTIWIRHVNNYYAVIDRLRARHPKLEIESCASGGGRVDLGVLTRTEEVWPSDNTDAFDRLSIQYGYSHAYTPKTMMAWVTDVPSMDQRSESLQYRFLVAMMGSLGIGSNLTKWTPEEFKIASRLIATYKRIRGTVQEGDLYRLLAPGESSLSANQYVSRDGKQSVLFAFLHAQQYGRQTPPIHLKGLAEQALYRVQVVEGRISETLETLSGAYLMNHGLTPSLKGEFDEAAILLERVDTTP